MTEKDTLRLFDLALAREIISLDRDELFRFVESREEQLRGMNHKRSVFVFSNDRPATRTTAMVFYEFFDEDPAQVRQMRINDLCYHGEPFEINYYSRCGYLDHPSSVYVDPASNSGAISSNDLFPWPEESEASNRARRFDVLNRDHIALMSESLKTNRDKVADEEYTTQLLTLRSMEKTLSSDSNLRAAYFYQS